MKEQTTPKPGAARKDAGDKSRVQGEGDYEAARRYDKGVAEFEKSHDVNKLARDAAPKSPSESQSMREAEEVGRSHSHGEDPAVKRRNTTTEGNPQPKDE